MSHVTMIGNKRNTPGFNDVALKEGLGKSKPHVALQAGAQSVHRTIRLLRAVADSNDRGMRLTQIAQKTGLPTTTVHRILAVLVAEEFLEYDLVSKCYRIGIELYAIASRARRFALRDKYRNCLENIARATQDSVYLVVRSGPDALCIDYIEGKSTIRIMTYDVGSRRPLGIGAGSLALLAFAPDDEVEGILKANELRYRKNNNMTVSELKGLIKQARALGYAFNQGHFMKGINGVGVPIYDEQGDVVAAVSVGSITERINPMRSQEIAELIKSEIALMR
ncbi:MAG: IclR family transcriptional regulator [Desulfobacterales bacterium]|nr:MAG: IclR family transcriptional regulator [Desulfobacterales bacterium]